MTERELFKEAVMQYMIDDAQVRRRRKAPKAHRAARRVLFAAACLLILLSVTVFAIPSARAAVEEWISGWFSARDYFGQEKSERTEEPSIVAITGSANNAGITLSSVGSGYEAYAKDFSMTLDEIAYDGTSIYISGTMSGATARPFVQAYTGGDTFRAVPYDGSLGGDPDWEYYYLFCENIVSFEAPDGSQYSGELVPTFTPEMDDFCQSLTDTSADNVFQDGELVTTNPAADEFWNKYLADHDVRFSMELQNNGPEAQPLSGQVTGELSIRMRYDNVDSKDPIQVLSASFGEISFDADAYKAGTKTTQAKGTSSVQLGGIHPVTVQEWQPVAERTSENCAVYYYTHMLDFTGASFSLKEITFTPTDTRMILHVLLPASWTREERAGGEFGFHFWIDGKAIEENAAQLFGVTGPEGTDYFKDDFLEFDYVFYESTLSPSQWAAMKTLTVIPTTGYWWEMSLSDNDNPLEAYSLKDDVVVTTYANVTNTMYNELHEEMPEYALTINLDDYR